MKRRNVCLILILLIVISNSVKAQLKLPGEAPPKWVTNLDHFVDVPTPTASSLVLMATLESRILQVGLI